MFRKRKKIKRLLEKLEKEIYKQWGVVPSINVYIHNTRNQYTAELIDKHFGKYASGLKVLEEFKGR